MSRLVDPTICPDCRATLDSSGTCTACGLTLQGPAASQLWSLMVRADRLVEQLRVPALAVPVPVAAPGSGPTLQLPAYPTPAARSPHEKRRLPSGSVPVVLLSLGALCVLVAAIVFAAVTWSLLGLTGRTMVLLGFTGLLALVGVVLTDKGLRGAAETFWLVVAGMLTVDLLAAQSAGLAGLDALDWRGTGALVGGALVLMGAGVGTWARHRPVERLYGVEAVAVVGAIVLTATNAWYAVDPAIGTSVAIPLLVAFALLVRRPVPLTAYGVGGLAVASWLVLLGIGWDRALETVSLGAWWSDFRGWPLLVAALFAAATVHWRGLPSSPRSVAAGLALFPLVLLANAPDTADLAGSTTREVVVACLTLLVLALVTQLASQVWARGAAALTAIGTLALGALLLVAPWPDLADAVDQRPAAWTAVLVGLSLTAALASLVRHLPEPSRAAGLQTVAVLGTGALGLGALVLVLQLDQPSWAAVLTGSLATAAAGAAAWWVRRETVPSVLGSLATAYLAAVTLYAASASYEQSAIVSSVLAVALVVAFAVSEREGRDVAAAGCAAIGILVGGYALSSWGRQFGADQDTLALALAVYAGLAGVLAAPATRRWIARISFEAAATVLAVTAVALSTDAPTAAMTLTIVGTGICLVTVSTRDRLFLGWVGAVVLGAATVIRVVDQVTAPELYTLPAAALLIAFGAWRLRTDPATGSFVALGSGLTLALLPSLLLALEEPVSVRGALIAAAGVLCLAVGVAQRISAPFVLGAVTTGVLALRHLQPIADAVPRWISLGLVGVALLMVGITWEARRRNVETAGRYLTALR